jgi:hypothetical protein
MSWDGRLSPLRRPRPMLQAHRPLPPTGRPGPAVGPTGQVLAGVGGSSRDSVGWEVVAASAPSSYASGSSSAASDWSSRSGSRSHGVDSRGSWRELAGCRRSGVHPFVVVLSSRLIVQLRLAAVVRLSAPASKNRASIPASRIGPAGDPGCAGDPCRRGCHGLVCPRVCCNRGPPESEAALAVLAGFLLALPMAASGRDRLAPTFTRFFNTEDTEESNENRIIGPSGYRVSANLFNAEDTEDTEESNENRIIGLSGHPVIEGIGCCQGKGNGRLRKAWGG